MSHIIVNIFEPVKIFTIYLFQIHRSSSQFIILIPSIQEWHLLHCDILYEENRTVLIKFNMVG